VNNLQKNSTNTDENLVENKYKRIIFNLYNERFGLNEINEHWDFSVNYEDIHSDSSYFIEDKLIIEVTCRHGRGTIFVDFLEPHLNSGDVVTYKLIDGDLYFVIDRPGIDNEEIFIWESFEKAENLNNKEPFAL